MSSGKLGIVALIAHFGKGKSCSLERAVLATLFISVFRSLRRLPSFPTACHLRLNADVDNLNIGYITKFPHFSTVSTLHCSDFVCKPGHTSLPYSLKLPRCIYFVISVTVSRHNVEAVSIHDNHPASTGRHPPACPGHSSQPRRDDRPESLGGRASSD